MVPNSEDRQRAECNGDDVGGLVNRPRETLGLRV